MTRWVLVVIIGAIAGCAPFAPASRPSALLLTQADRLVSQGQLTGAVDVYGEILTKYPETEEAVHARSRRETLTSLLAARAQVSRLTSELRAQEAELARVREQVAARDGELARARQELARVGAETERLRAESERLRADLENLKKIDIDLERRRK